MMEPKCPSCGEFAGATICALQLDVQLDEESALPTFMIYCGKCGYNFAVLPLTEQILTTIKERKASLPHLEKEQLWSFVRFVPKPDWMK